MAKVRVSFPVLEDFSSKAGMPLHKVFEGDAALNKNALAALTAKDDAGNLQYPRVNANRELVVSSETGLAADLSAAASSIAGSTAAYQAVATITLQVDLVYQKLEYIAACFRDTEFRIVHNDDGTPAVIVEGIIVGSGCFTNMMSLIHKKFTAGSTGTQELILQGKNLDTVSDLSGTLTVQEVQV